jgi:osmotically inducible protein OsmC
MEKVDTANRITNIHLEVSGTIPDITDDKFQELANNAKIGCPISVALSAVPISMTAVLG